MKVKTHYSQTIKLSGKEVERLITTLKCALNETLLSPDERADVQALVNALSDNMRQIDF